MAVDPDAVGKELPHVRLTVDAGRLRFFAKAIGETDPVYTGDRPLVPPTFLFGIEFEQPDPFAWLAQIGVDLRHVLHGEQSFIYHAVARAGDTLIAKPRITDVYTKRDGAMEFIIKETSVTNDVGMAVADLSSTVIVRRPEATQ